MTHLIALDQGTTSSRALIVDETGHVVAIGQLEHVQHFPQPGWVEHDAAEIWSAAQQVIELALGQAGLTAADIAAVGITNQRETTVVWDRATGEPVHRAIVWQDTRTQHRVDEIAASPVAARVTELTGLPLASYFSATKISWILDRVPGARERAERGELLAGTTDSWLLWNLTGGPDGGVHATDVTNASRTLLMGLESLAWEDELLEVFGIPRAMLPGIRSSSEVYGTVTTGPLTGIPVAGILGDQQAATFGQAAFAAGESKNTYGTGSFILVNTGTQPVRSENGLITTVAYQIGDEAPHYAIEGSIAVAGSLIQWLRDNLGIISSSAEVEELALSAEDNGGVHLVPAFSGLFAPHWRPDARGVIVGLTRFATRAHIARAALEAVAFQTREVIDALTADLAGAGAIAAGADGPMSELRVDGGMVRNATLMQFQADILGIPVVRPELTETTALGAAFAAGLAVGVWPDVDALRAMWREEARFAPQMDDAEREHRLAQWRKAVERSLGWVD